MERKKNRNRSSLSFSGSVAALKGKNVCGMGGADVIFEGAKRVKIAFSAARINLNVGQNNFWGGGRCNCPSLPIGSAATGCSFFTPANLAEKAIFFFGSQQVQKTKLDRKLS